MVKVNINIDKIENALKDYSAKEAYLIKTVQSNASRVSFPEGDYGWGNVVEKIDDCVEKANKYVSWVNKISSEYSKTFTSGAENISSNKIKEVPINTIIVK